MATYPGRDFHAPRADVVREAPHEGGFSCQGKLCIALDQGPLRQLPIRDVVGDAEQTLGNALRVAQDRPLDRDPTRLTGVWMAGRMYHPVFRVPDSTAAPSFCKGGIHELQILRMDEASSFADRPGQRVVAMNERGTRIAFEATGRNVHVERTEVGATQRQLELLVAHLQRGLAAISFGEQGREDQDDQCAGHGERLRSEDAIRNGQAHVCKVPDGKSCRPDYGQGYDECRSGREHRPAAHRNPKQDGKDDADGQGGGPGLLRQRNQEHVEDGQRRQACRPLDQLATCRRVAQGCTQANHERGDRDRSQQARHEPDLPT